MYLTLLALHPYMSNFSPKLWCSAGFQTIVASNECNLSNDDERTFEPHLILIIFLPMYIMAFTISIRYECLSKYIALRLIGVEEM